MKFQIIFKKGDRHDATIHYVDIIRLALLELSTEVSVIESVKEIDSKKNIIVVVNAKSHLEVLLKNPFQKVICWYQGIMPEELFVNHRKKDKKFKIGLWTVFEFLSLKFIYFPIFVSERMKTHFEHKYKRRFSEDFYVMPCFNSEIDKSSFDFPNKYKQPTFLYAGTMSEWQCIDEILELYSNIEKEIPNAQLFLYTPDQEIAANYMKKFSISNYKIDYVPYQQLSMEIRKFKYGFIIRKDIEMNRVATPTKMNSYLANGIIPIFSNCIHSFNDNLSRLKYKILIDKENNHSYIIDKLRELENSTDIEDSIYQDFVENAFTSYYNSNFHIKKLSQQIRKKILI
ncbi:hypothetical protein [Chryseobacterium sp.]|uniref:hypothetical protein n=1 Tax=Chryseobacterium sp. TaxID=1871047 RepID=UPI0028A0DA14|nr:hypothetical protein [Chryseobacterium sp.]